MNVRDELRAPDPPLVMGLDFHKLKTQRLVRKTSYDSVECSAVALSAPVPLGFINELNLTLFRIGCCSKF